MIVYGIPNCNTVKKATDWLKNNKIEFDFHNFKKDGITERSLKNWINALGWEKLVNKKGTTWKKLTLEQQLKVTNNESAIELMIEKPSVIKRPVIEVGEKLLVGFEETEYEKVFKK